MAAGIASIADRLVASQRRCFVGRARDCSCSSAARCGVAAVRGAVVPRARRCRQECVARARCVSARMAPAATLVRVDGASIERGPQAFSTPRPRATRAHDDPGVLLIDSCERLAPLQPWLREQFLPTLPARWLAVCAGRGRPTSAGATTRSGRRCCTSSRWRASARPKAARCSPRAVWRADRHAAGAGVRARPSAGAEPAGRRAAPVRDRRCTASPPGGSVVQSLVERFTQDVPDARHLDALRVAAFVRDTNEEVLAAVLAGDDARPLFDWLRSLGFMQPSAARAGAARAGARRARGRHDVARPGAHRRAARRGVPPLLRRIAATHGRARAALPGGGAVRAAPSPHKEQFFDWSAARRAPRRAGARRGSQSWSAMVARHEGDAALRWLAPLVAAPARGLSSCSGTPQAAATASC